MASGGQAHNYMKLQLALVQENIFASVCHHVSWWYKTLMAYTYEGTPMEMVQESWVR